MMQAMTVRRSRLRSTTVEPAIDPPSCPPPNMSDRPPPRPECNRIRKISSSATMTSMTMRIALSMSRGFLRFRPARKESAYRPSACGSGRPPDVTGLTLSGAVADDAGEVVGVERRAANERTVDLGLRHEVGRVPGFHAAAVLDADRLGRRLAVELAQRGADDADRVV